MTFLNESSLLKSFDLVFGILTFRYITALLHLNFHLRILPLKEKRMIAKSSQKFLLITKFGMLLINWRSGANNPTMFKSS